MKIQIFSEDTPMISIPSANVEQASLVEGIEIIGVSSLKELFLHLKNEQRIPACEPKQKLAPAKSAGPKIDDVLGQEQAKRAIFIAAAGHHNILLTGSPGAGKTMLARTLVVLLPAALEPRCSCYQAS